MPEFRQCSDYGVDGVDSSEIILEYDPTITYSLPPRLENKFQEIWELILEENPNLFDGAFFNLVEDTSEEYKLVLGPSRFRDYLVRRLLLVNDELVTGYDLSDKEEQYLRKHIHVLSSFVALVNKDYLLVGLKSGPKAGESSLSFPGSGYLDRDEDLGPSREMKPTREIILREIEEEVNLSDSIDRIQCLGVFEDCKDATHYNPAIFSIAEVILSKREIEGRISDAEDRWEFDDFIFIPAYNQDVVESIVKVGLSESTPSVCGLDSWIPDSTSGLTSKSLLMILLLGRNWFGQDWFDHTLTKYPNCKLIK